MVPDTIPQPISEPPVHILQLDLNTGHPKIIEPSPGNFFELLNALIETHRGRLAGDDFQLLFQVFPALFACNQLDIIEQFK